MKTNNEYSKMRTLIALVLGSNSVSLQDPLQTPEHTSGQVAQAVSVPYLNVINGAIHSWLAGTFDGVVYGDKWKLRASPFGLGFGICLLFCTPSYDLDEIANVPNLM